MVRAAMAYNPKSVLDVGCGRGDTVKMLRGHGIEAYGMDIERYSSDWYIELEDATDRFGWDTDRFDVVISNDFFEHIPEEHIDHVYSEMQRVSKGPVIARISVKEKEGHVTVKPIEWWKEKLSGCRFIGKDWHD